MDVNFFNPDTSSKTLHFGTGFFLRVSCYSAMPYSFDTSTHYIPNRWVRESEKERQAVLTIPNGSSEQRGPFGSPERNLQLLLLLLLHPASSPSSFSVHFYQP